MKFQKKLINCIVKKDNQANNTLKTVSSENKDLENFYVYHTFNN